MHCMSSQIHIQAMYNIQIHIHIIYNMHINNNNKYTKYIAVHRRQHSTDNTTQRALGADVVTADEWQSTLDPANTVHQRATTVRHTANTITPTRHNIQVVTSHSWQIIIPNIFTTLSIFNDQIIFGQRQWPPQQFRTLGCAFPNIVKRIVVTENHYAWPEYRISEATQCLTPNTSPPCGHISIH